MQISTTVKMINQIVDLSIANISTNHLTKKINNKYDGLIIQNLPLNLYMYAALIVERKPEDTRLPVRTYTLRAGAYMGYSDQYKTIFIHYNSRNNFLIKSSCAPSLLDKIISLLENGFDSETTYIVRHPSILINGEINIFNGKAFAFMCVQNSTLIINFADLENTQKIFIDISDKSKILETLHIFLKAFPDKSK